MNPNRFGGGLSLNISETSNAQSLEVVRVGELNHERHDRGEKERHRDVQRPHGETASSSPTCCSPSSRTATPLSTHLGLDGPADDGFERMAVSTGDRRGIPALSAWLTSRSDSEHSSPIRRGAWVADNMLYRPVPPTPAGLEVGEFTEAGECMSATWWSQPHGGQREIRMARDESGD